MSRATLASVGRVLEIAAVTGAFATIPLTLLLEDAGSNHWLQFADWTIWVFFLAEFVFTALCREGTNRRKFFLAALVILSFPALPSLLGLVRVARLFRIARISRMLRAVRVVGVTAFGLEALREILGRKGLLNVAALSGLIILASGGAVSWAARTAI
jgi:hypothetical protein